MGLLRWIAGFIVALAAVGFAIFNRQDVIFYFSPLHEPLTLPLCIVALGFMAAGFIIGAATVWLNAAPGRSNSRRQRKQIRALEKELAEAGQNTLKDEPPSDFFPALGKQGQ